MRGAYQENLRYFQQAYETREYHWSKTHCVLVEQFLDAILSQETIQETIDSMLDLGCGEGANVRMAAAKGLYAVGLDREPLAIRSARELSFSEGLGVETAFLVSDVLTSPFMPQSFGIVLDHGCLHHLRKSDWGIYQHNINLILKPRGYYIMEVFSTEHKGYGEVLERGWHIKDGAYRRFFREEDIRNFWGDRFEILELQEKQGEIAGDWHALMRRRY